MLGRTFRDSSACNLPAESTPGNYPHRAGIFVTPQIKRIKGLTRLFALADVILEQAFSKCRVERTSVVAGSGPASDPAG
jgi:hypothetical protein